MTLAASPPVTRIGELSPADRKRVAEILIGTGQFNEEEIDVALELFDAGLGARRSALGEQPIDPDYQFVGAFNADGTLLGYSCYGPTPQADRAWDLYWIAVAKEAHGRGIGSKLLAEVERRLLSERARILLIETSSRADYVATRTFYESRGYMEEARIADFYGERDDRVMFVKHLSLVTAET